MSGTLVNLVDSTQARQTCPVCGKPRKPAELPTQWHHHRAIFSCGAVFIARGESIEVERACGDRSALAAELWTIEATPGNGRAVCISPDRDPEGAMADMILALAVAATKGGFNALTICELIRDEMALFSKFSEEDGA